MGGLNTQLGRKKDEVSRLQRELTSAQSQSQTLLQEKTGCVSRLEAQLGRLEGEKEGERGREKRREEEWRRSLEQSEGVRRSLLAQVERNGQELEKMTERLRALQGREGEAERCRAEASQLHKLVCNFENHCFYRLVSFLVKFSPWNIATFNSIVGKSKLPLCIELF